MRVACPASNASVPVPSPAACRDVGDDVFAKPALLLPFPHGHAQQCLCSSFLAIHFDIITERLTHVMPTIQDVSRLCSSTPSSGSCYWEETAFPFAFEQQARAAFDFASAAVGVSSGVVASLGSDSVSPSSQQSSCSEQCCRAECWCSDSSRGCPWEPLVNVDVLEGMMHGAPLPLSLAAALNEVMLIL